MRGDPQSPGGQWRFITVVSHCCPGATKLVNVRFVGQSKDES